MRKFTQKIQMECTSEQYDTIHDQLEKLGHYTLLRGMPSNMTSIFIEEGTISWSQMKPKKNGYLNIGPFNADLFLALAACSEGDEFWPGEYAVALKGLAGTGTCKLGGIYKIQSVNMSDVQVEDDWVKNGGEKGSWTAAKNFRKATVSELIAYFSAKNAENSIHVNAETKVDAEWTDEQKSFFEQNMPDQQAKAEHFADMAKLSSALEEFEPGEMVNAIHYDERKDRLFYGDPSTSSNGHYVYDKAGNIFKVAKVERLHRIEYDQLLISYAKSKGIDVSQIVVIPTP